MLVLLVVELMKCAVEMASRGMIYLPSFMKIDIGVPAIFWFGLSNSNGCNFSISNGWNYELCRSDGLRWHGTHIKIDKYWYRRSSNIKFLLHQF
jgi:hypothetical protein